MAGGYPPGAIIPPFQLRQWQSPQSANVLRGENDPARESRLKEKATCNQNKRLRPTFRKPPCHACPALSALSDSHSHTKDWARRMNNQSHNVTGDAEQQVQSLNRNDRNSIHSQKTGSSGLINIYFYDICEAETHRSMTNASLKSLTEFPITTVTEACLSFLWKFQYISNEYISFWIGCVSQSGGRVVLKILFITHPRVVQRFGA